MKKIFAVLSVFFLLSACVYVKRDYEVKENSLRTSSAPAWIRQSGAHRADPVPDTKQNRYFVSNAQNANQHLCLKASELNATRKIAADTAREIMNDIEKKNKTANKKNTADPELKDNLEKNILVNLYHVTVVGKYWEKRGYLKEMGAEKDYIAYKCDTAVKIKKSDLAKAIETAKTKINQRLKNESKKIINKTIDSHIAKLKVGK